MAYIGASPADRALTSADIEDGAITTAKIQNDAIDNTKLDLTDDYAFTGTISGAGDLTLLSSQTGSSVASVEVGNTVITSSYDRYLIHLSGKNANDSERVYARLLNDGTENTSNINGTWNDLGGGSYSRYTSGFYNLTPDEVLGNDVNEGFSFLIELLMPLSSTIPTRIFSFVGYANATDGNRGEIGCGRRADGTETHNGIKFYPSVGNFSEIKLQVYGMKK